MVAPLGSILNFSWNGGANTAEIRIDDISTTFEVDEFARDEFNNDRLKAAPTTTGALPSIQQSWSNQPIQTSSSCSGDVPRPLGPNDSNVDAIKQKFNAISWDIKASPNLSSPVNSLYNLYTNHRQLLSKFKLHLEEASSMNLSITYLLGLQSETFSYLTSTGLSMTGRAIDGQTYTDLLITSFSAITDYEVSQKGGGYLVLKSFNMKIEKRAIFAQSSVV